MRTLLPLLLPALVAPVSAAQNAPLVQPTGLATLNSALTPVAISRTLVAFPASESAQGADLNGDLDQLDWVMQVHDLRSGNVRSLGHAGAATIRSAATDRHVAFYVHEFQDGMQDANGDGDLGDYVAFLFDRATGQVQSLGIAVNPNVPPEMTDALLVVAASEGGQGSTDLDGDGLVSECVYVIDLATNAGTPLAPRPVGAESSSTTAFAISGTRVYWRALATRRVWVSDRATNVTADLGWRSGSDLLTRGGVVAFSVPEAENGPQDLNGDGDTNDVVTGVVRSSGGPAQILMLEGGFPMSTRVALGSNRLVGLRHEGGPFGTDLNGDADTLDRVLFLYDDRTSAFTNLGRTYATGGPLVADVEGELVAFGVSEQGEGVDFNGDGDVLDIVVEMIDGSGTQVAHVDLAVQDSLPTAIQISRGQLGILVSESAHGRDLDNDGLLVSDVPHVFDPVQWFLPAVNLGVGSLPPLSNSFHFHRGRASVIVHEMATDLNGDGDANDNVLVVRGTTPNSALDVNVALASGFVSPPTTVRARDGVLAFAASEVQSGNTSLNGDGDTTDRVAFVLRMNP